MEDYFEIRSAIGYREKIFCRSINKTIDKNLLLLVSFKKKSLDPYFVPSTYMLFLELLICPYLLLPKLYYAELDEGL